MPSSTSALMLVTLWPQRMSLRRTRQRMRGRTVWRAVLPANPLMDDAVDSGEMHPHLQHALETTPDDLLLTRVFIVAAHPGPAALPGFPCSE